MVKRMVEKRIKHNGQNVTVKVLCDPYFGMLELDAFPFTDDEGSCFAVQMLQRHPQQCQYFT